MGVLVDLRGRRFGRLLVQSRYGSGVHKCATWTCCCDCGSVKTISSGALLSGKTQSCGCLWKERVRKRLTKHGCATGGKLTREYLSWTNMKQRCSNKNNPSFNNYGGRGIKVCARWKDFRSFLADMGVCPPGFTIERIRVDDGYRKGNCLWVPRPQQNLNKTNNRLLTFQGETKAAAIWADELEISKPVLYQRIHRGWSDERALSQPTIITKNCAR
mgnify:CR=1 FL=1